MLRKAPESDSLDFALNQPKIPEAAIRIARGVKIVERDANPHRRHGITFEHLGKLNPISSRHLEDLIACFAELLPTPSSARRITVLGLAESGIVPAFAMHEAANSHGFDANWCFSSRTNQGGPGFVEAHSHAPEHFLPPEILVDFGEELWIVEDEVTTGQTLLNLLEVVRRTTEYERVRCFSVLDARSPDHSENNQVPQQLEVRSILQGDLSEWLHQMNPSSLQSRFDGIPHLSIGELIASDLPALLTGELPQLQHVTLSPWTIDQKAILSRLEYMPGYYLYNTKAD